MNIFLPACLAASLVANIALALLVTSLTDRLRHPRAKREAKAVTPHAVDVRRHPRPPLAEPTEVIKPYTPGRIAPSPLAPRRQG